MRPADFGAGIELVRGLTNSCCIGIIVVSFLTHQLGSEYRCKNSSTQSAWVKAGQYHIDYYRLSNSIYRIASNLNNSDVHLRGGVVWDRTAVTRVLYRVETSPTG